MEGIVTTFGAGLLTSLSPCVYPMIPISVGYFGSQAERGTKTNIVLFFIGQLLTFTVLGIIASTIGEVFGFSSQNPIILGVVGVMLIIFGIFSLTGFVPGFMQKFNQFQFNRFEGSFFFPILAGAGSALIASPCTTPVLGAVLMTISTAEQFWMGSVYMFFYALGTTLIFLVLGLGIVSAKKLPRSGPWMTKIHKASAVLILLAGVYFLYRSAAEYLYL